MSQRPLSIVGLGMISSLGIGAEANAAAMRCGYDGFQQTSFNQPYSAESQLGAQIEGNLRGISKLSYMSQTAVSEALKNLPKDYQHLTVLYCMPDTDRSSFFTNEEALQAISHATFKDTQLGTLNPASSVLWQHRCGFVKALAYAQTLLHEKQHDYVLIIAIDSLLNSATLAQYGGGLYGENRRLLGEDHSNGFIPGEAATAVLLSTPTKNPSPVIISGVGSGREKATFDNEEDILKGNGLASAINAAAKDANVAIHETAFRVSSVSGEEYFFTEAALAQIKTLKQKVAIHPLWHPADSVGEVGAAIGGVMLIMTYFAFIKHYALGSNALCHISNDNLQRGAFIMQYQPTQQRI